MRQVRLKKSLLPSELNIHCLAVLAVGSHSLLNYPPRLKKSLLPSELNIHPSVSTVHTPTGTGYYMENRPISNSQQTLPHGPWCLVIRRCLIVFPSGHYIRCQKRQGRICDFVKYVYDKTTPTSVHSFIKNNVLGKPQEVTSSLQSNCNTCILYIFLKIS